MTRRRRTPPQSNQQLPPRSISCNFSTAAFHAFRSLLSPTSVRFASLLYLQRDLRLALALCMEADIEARVRVPRRRSEILSSFCDDGLNSPSGNHFFRLAVLAVAA